MLEVRMVPLRQVFQKLSRVARRLERDLGKTVQLHFVGGVSDPERVALPPGRYRLTATRGPEFGLDERVVERACAGAEVRG